MSEKGGIFSRSSAKYPMICHILAIFIPYEIIHAWDTVLAIIYLPIVFLSIEFLFNNGLGLFINYLLITDPHTKLSIDNRSFPSLVTDFPCGFWCCWWTTCFLYGCTPFELYFKQFVCKFGMIKRNFLFTCYLYSWFQTYPIFANCISSQIIFVHAKNFVLSYSIKVESTVSNIHFHMLWDISNPKSPKLEVSQPD